MATIKQLERTALKMYSRYIPNPTQSPAQVWYGLGMHEGYLAVKAALKDCGIDGANAERILHPLYEKYDVVLTGAEQLDKDFWKASGAFAYVNGVMELCKIDESTFITASATTENYIGEQ